MRLTSRLRVRPVWSHVAGGDVLRAQALAALDAYQSNNPDSFGATMIEILRSAPAIERPLLSVAVDALIAEKSMVRFGQLLHLPGYAVKLSLEEENLWFEVARVLRAGGNDPPRLALLADTLRVSEDELKPLLEKLARMGRLRRVGKRYFVLPEIVAILATAARICVSAHPEAILTVGQFREATGISRNATMPVLEFFDRVGFTSRHQDGRRLRASGSTIFDVPVERLVAE